MANEFRLSFTAEEIDEKLRKVDSMGASAQSDWNQTDSSAADFIKNKPFGDMPTGGDTLYWDGNTEGLVCVVDFLYKVSDIIPPVDELKDTYIKITMSEGTEFMEKGTVEAIGGVHTIAGESCWIVTKTGAGVDINGFSFPEPGIYFLKTEGGYASSLWILDYTGFPVTKKMEEKYLPGAVILYSDGTYLYNTEDVTDAAKRTTKAEFEKLLFSIQKICVGVDDGGMIYFTPDMYYEEENYMVASSSAAQLGFYTAEYTAS